MGHELVKENCHEFVQRYRYGHPIFMVKMIYGAVAGAIKGADKKLLGKRGKSYPFTLDILEILSLLFNGLAFELGFPQLR